MRSSDTQILAISLAVLSLTAAAPSFAQAPPSQVEADRFELNASVTAKSQLSRGEVDRSALGMGSLPTAKRVVQDSLIATAPEQPQTAPVSDEVPGSYLQEMNIDWSRWVSTLADRWFYVLRNAEYSYGVQFSTARPALIQFTCYADGTIGKIVLKQSSGVSAYDRLQIDALLSAAPTPAFPPGTKRTSITLVQGWESHPKQAGEQDFQPGSFGKDFPREKVRQWSQGR